MISQLARTIYGQRDLLYLLLIGSTTTILIMAANTAFADFPRLGALHAGDGFLPRSSPIAAAGWFFRAASSPWQ